jgi:capsular exopolysaccharide synthesis family protein
MSRFYDVLREAGRLVQDEPADQPGPSRPAASTLTPDHQEPPPSGPLPVPPSVDRRLPTAGPQNAAAQAQSAPAPPLPKAVSRAAGSPLQFKPTDKLLPNAAKLVIKEQYRRLRTKILQLQGDADFRILMVTSAGPQEGKTVTSLNLGISFAMLPNFKVLVVDADVRRGTLSEYLGIREAAGLSNVIDGSARLEDVIVRYPETSLEFLLRGTSEIAPAELFHSRNTSAHFQRLRESYDLVIVDTPPINVIAETQLIAANCDAALLVARAFETTRKSLEKATRDLSSVRVIGTVLNGGTRAQVYRGYEGYY